nr:MAG TPA: hypothetical protein [Caudoviricetes sp.]
MPIFFPGLKSLSWTAFWRGFLLSFLGNSNKTIP